MLHYFALTYLLYEATTVFMNPFVMMEMMKTHPTKKRGIINYYKYIYDYIRDLYINHF
jgi:hypothetical protein